MAELCDLSATQLRAMIGAKQASPVEILDSCIARTKAVDGALNAMVTPAYEQARAAARMAEEAVMRADPLGIIHGLPVAVKDLDETAGVKTTFGSRIFADNIPVRDQGMVARFRAVGGIVLGKTNTPEFGTGGNTRNLLFGTTANPFDRGKTSGGSSGGSAVALATGMAPLATGSDYGGSLRTPASFCGIVGYRPSPGLVAIEDSGIGLLPFAVSGPMARSVDDTVLMLRAMMGFDRRDVFAASANRDIPDPLMPADLSTLRVAFSPDLGVAAVSQHYRELFAARTTLFRHHFGQAEDRNPDMAEVHHAFEVLRAMSYIAAYGDLVKAHPDELSPNVIDNVERGYGYSIEDVATAHQIQTQLARNWLAMFDEIDVMICPAASVSPFAHTNWSVNEIDGVRMDSYMRWLAISYAPTMALACSLALPCGLDHQGMPFGIQILGPPGGDAKLLAIAKSIEMALAQNPLTARPLPDLGALASA